MATQLKVCIGSYCGPKGGRALIKDIEDLCGPGNVISSSCFDKCTMGPNIQVLKGGKSQKLLSGIDSWKKAEASASKEGNAKFSPEHKKIAEIKYQARRETKDDVRMTLINKAFKIMGDEAAAQRTEPHLFASLLVMRAMETFKEKAAEALADSQLALQLVPNWGTAYMAVAAAQESLGMCELAEDALGDAEESHHPIDGLLRGRLEKAIKMKRKEEEDKLKAEKAEKANAEKEAKKLADEEAKKIAAAEKKKKAAEDAKLKKKADAEAKLKAEAEAKEEEARKQAEKEAEEAKIKEEAEAAAIAAAEAEEAAKNAWADEEAARKKAEQDAKLAEEAAQKKAIEDAEAAEEAMRKQKQAEMMLAKRAEAAEARKKAEASWFGACCASPKVIPDDEKGDECLAAPSAIP